jgi:ribonuclease Z
MSPKIKTAWIALLSVGVAVGIVITGNLGQQTQAQESEQAQANTPLGRKATAVVDGQYPASYFPNTELLGPDEMRITALGTGMPNQTRAAVSISYLVELGNGDKFLFDVGSGMLANLFSLRPDFSRIDKVFASHLHVDHVGDFMAFHIGG